jgi:hypothetical protein
MRGRGKPMTARTKSVERWDLGGKKPLGLAWGLETLHASLPLPGRLVRVLRAIIEIPMLVMFHPWEDLALSGSIGLQFVCDQHPRDIV